MYARYAYIGVVWEVNVGIYGIHGVYHRVTFNLHVSCTDISMYVSIVHAFGEAGGDPTQQQNTLNPVPRLAAAMARRCLRSDANKYVVSSSGNSTGIVGQRAAIKAQSAGITM